jgi:pyridoxal phosphate enzyme (YggS family)
MADLREQLRERLAQVEERIAAACRKGGRPRQDILLVAVTKTVSVEVAGLLPDLGVVHLGESRPQELWRKATALPSSIHWHQIGHLQTNKIERTLPLVQLIHSVDSLRLLQALDQEAMRQQRRVEIMLEVNASGEANKHGFAPAEIQTVLPLLPALKQVQLRGLMTMAAYAEDPEQCRPTFALLRELRDRLAPQVPPPHALDQLSMGMSNDYPIAIEEGATMIRLGTILFEGIAPEPPP